MTSSKSRTSEVMGCDAGATCLPVISSRPPLIAYSSALARLTRAPKNCICLPTVMADTQQAIAASSPHWERISSSDSYWIDEVSIETLAQNSLKPRGRSADHSTVRFGSGAGPRLYRVCRKRNELLVTSVRPSSPMPPMLSVTQVGSPENSASYSGVRKKRTMRSLMTKSSMSSWACSSVRVPSSRSRWM